MAAKGRITIKRVYAAPSNDDGLRVLVDRLWPRGLSKEEARIDLWLKDLAPSGELRQWFGHKEERWKEFHRRYLEELKDNEAVNCLRRISENNNVTLLFAARNEDKNNAAVLKELIGR
jgi:uncharacterized protein YeaO (DUF488 family)